MNKVLIGITTAETVCNETLMSIYNMEIPQDTVTELKIVHSYNVADGRNDLINIMLAGDYTHLFFVDSDVILPKNALKDLLGMTWYISVGTYVRKEPDSIFKENPFTTLYNHDDRNKEIYCPTFMAASSLEEGKITPTDCCGMGCVLIHRDLFSKIEQPYFFFAHEGNPRPGNWDEYCIGEDMYFCRKVIRAGIQIWAHGSVLCGHVGKYIYNVPKFIHDEQGNAYSVAAIEKAQKEAEEKAQKEKEAQEAATQQEDDETVNMEDLVKAVQEKPKRKKK